MRILATVLAALLVAPALSAQTAYVGMSGGAGRLVPGTTGTTPVTAPVGGAEGGVRAGFLTVMGRYAQGSFAAPQGPSTLVTGESRLGVQLLSWLNVSGGPLVLSWGNATRERWVMWEGGLRVSAPLAGDAVRSYVEWYRGLSGTVNIAAGVAAGSQGAVGLAASAGPVTVVASYNVLHVSSGVVERTVDVLGLAVRIGGGSS